MKRGGVLQERVGDPKKQRVSYTMVTWACSQVPDYVVAGLLWWTWGWKVRCSAKCVATLWRESTGARPSATSGSLESIQLGLAMSVIMTKVISTLTQWCSWRNSVLNLLECLPWHVLWFKPDIAHFEASIYQVPSDLICVLQSNHKVNLWLVTLNFVIPHCNTVWSAWLNKLRYVCLDIWLNNQTSIPS